MQQAEELQPTGNPEEDELKKAAYVDCPCRETNLISFHNLFIVCDKR